MMWDKPLLLGGSPAPRCEGGFHEPVFNHAEPFTMQAAQWLTAGEVRTLWPRATRCQCGARQGAFYVSLDHMLAGDW